MAEKHWFDTLNASLVQAADRRGVLHAAGALVAALAVSRIPAIADAKGKGKGKAKGKKKGKGNNKGPGKYPKHPRPGHYPTPEPDVDDCEDFLGHFEPWIVDDCRKDQRACKAPNHFCIFAVDNDSEDDRGYGCCLRNEACCFHGCTDTRTDKDNCGRCNESCDDGEVCRKGKCVCEGSDCDDPDPCAKCTPNQICKNGQCVSDLCRINPNHCGPDRVCVNGDDCVCPAGYKECPDPYIGPGGCTRSETTCCGRTACSPVQPCCGEGADAYCSNHGKCP